MKPTNFLRKLTSDFCRICYKRGLFTSPNFPSKDKHRPKQLCTFKNHGFTLQVRCMCGRFHFFSKMKLNSSENTCAVDYCCCLKPRISKANDSYTCVRCKLPKRNENQRVINCKLFHPRFKDKDLKQHFNTCYKNGRDGTPEDCNDCLQSFLDYHFERIPNLKTKTRMYFFRQYLEEECSHVFLRKLRSGKIIQNCHQPFPLSLPLKIENCIKIETVGLPNKMLQAVYSGDKHKFEAQLNRGGTISLSCGGMGGTSILFDLIRTPKRIDWADLCTAKMTEEEKITFVNKKDSLVIDEGNDFIKFCKNNNKKTFISLSSRLSLLATADICCALRGVRILRVAFKKRSAR